MNTGNSKSSPTSVWRDVERLLKDRHLMEALDNAVNILIGNGNLEDADFLKDVRRSYAFMLEYAITGGADPDRDLVISDVSADLKGVVAENILMSKTADSPSTFPSLKRLDRMQNIPIDNIVKEYEDTMRLVNVAEEEGNPPSTLLARKEQSMIRIFEKAMVSSFSSRSDLKKLTALCTDSHQPFELKALIVAAFYLSFSFFFNRHKFMALFDILEGTDDDKLKARLFVSIFMTLCQWNDEIETDIRLRQRVDEWKDSLINYTLIREVIESYLRSLDTKRVTKMMRDKVMPDINSIRPELLNSLKQKIQEGEAFDPDGNPEWEELFRKSGLEKKMRQLSELQSEGADMMMLPLSGLKQGLPFFNTLSNWFLPFTLQHSQLAFLRDAKLSGMSVLFDDYSGMCHTDRFSLALAINRIPEVQRNMMFGQLETQAEQIKTEMRDRLMKTNSPVFKMELDRYMRDLYRFFTLYRRHGDFYNPFAGTRNLMHISILQDWISQPEMKILMSEFFFKRGYYAEALILFEDTVNSDGASDGYIWQKIGYCHQRLNHPSEALQAYAKAELFQAADNWLVCNEARCNETLSRYSKAAPLYLQAWEADESRLKWLVRSAVCYFRIEKASEIMPKLYKADYEQPSDQISILIIVGEISGGNHEKALERMQRLKQTRLADMPHDIKYLYMLEALSVNDYKQAIDLMAGSEADDMISFSARMQDWGVAQMILPKIELLQEMLYLRRHNW
ncbi:MAG: hypothetical protein NC328_06595 [Muribaculum sp.]|nr:hypothetical protein [Muribaculum sp.]